MPKHILKDYELIWKSHNAIWYQLKFLRTTANSSKAIPRRNWGHQTSSFVSKFNVTQMKTNLPPLLPPTIWQMAQDPSQMFVYKQMENQLCMKTYIININSRIISEENTNKIELINQAKQKAVYILTFLSNWNLFWTRQQWCLPKLRPGRIKLE